jgi:hypothetical protein
LLGLYGDFSLSYKSIITVNATLRNDWSSTFKIGKNSYLYNGVGASLNITELFPKIRNKFIDDIKVRGNVATVGKAGTDFIYATDSYYGGAGSADGFGPTIAFPFNGIQGYSLNNGAGNPDLGPEFTQSKEIAGEVSLFKGRIKVEVTKYLQKSRKLIFAVPVSASSGITAFTQNAGNLTTRGVELGVNLTPVNSKSVTWNINLAYTQFKSIVNSLAPGVTNIFLGGFVTPNIRLVAGDEYGQIYGNAYLRDPNKGNKIVVGSNGLPFVTANVQRIGNPNPKYTMGITNTVSYKSISLSFLMEIKEGGEMYSRNIADLQRNGVAIETAQYPRYDAAGVLQKPYLFDAVYTNGLPNTTYVSAQDYFGNSGKYAAAEGFIYKTSWFRIREASMTYTLPADFLKKTPFGNATFSVFGRNLFLNSPFYPHLDPEQNVLGVSAQGAQGLEFNALPQTRTIGVGLNLSF